MRGSEGEYGLWRVERLGIMFGMIHDGVRTGMRGVAGRRGAEGTYFVGALWGARDGVTKFDVIK